jgi:hypothetical protein
MTASFGIGSFLIVLLTSLSPFAVTAPITASISDGFCCYFSIAAWENRGLLNGRGAVAAPAGGLHQPYALVLGYISALAASAPTLPAPGESRSTMRLPVGDT